MAAKDTKLDDRSVAVKMVPPELAHDLVAVSILKKEAQVALALTHENIVRLHTFEEADGEAFLVMELVEGRSLLEVLHEKGPFTAEEAERIALEVCKGLSYAHGKKVIHRDLKPANIMLTRDGRVKIADFGIARVLKDTMTRFSGKPMATSGTLPYMSPEQLRGGPPNAATDIYALGATLYELLSGNPPFHTGDIHYQILNEPPRPPGRLPAGSFTMGSPSSEPGRDSNEREHRVTISRSFYMQTTEVTQGQWEKVMGSNPSRFQNCGEKCPVEQVSWLDAVKFCNKLSELEGLRLAYRISGESVTWDRSANGYRLPTEAEREYACRAGTTTALYTGPIQILGDNNAPALDSIAWYSGNSGVDYNGGYDCSGWKEKQRSSSRCGTHPVGRKDPNRRGLYDTIGNVWEWCWGWYGGYPSGQVTDPVGPGNGSYRVDRGGSWSFDARYCRSAVRYDYSPGSRRFSLGFRLCRSGE